MKPVAIQWVGFITLLLIPFAFSAQAVWESLEGPEGGYVTSMDVNADGDLFAIVGFYSLFKSENDGGNWTEMAISSDNVYQIYVLSDGALLLFSEGEGMWKSTDNGQAWSLITSLGFYDLLETDEGVLFGNTRNGIYKSLDKGLNWSFCGQDNHFFFDIAFSPSGEIFAVANYNYGTFSKSKVFRLTGQGETWETVLEDPELGAYWSLAVLPSGTILVQGPEEFLRSTDSGNSWESLSCLGFGAIWVTGEGRLFGSNSGIFGGSAEPGLWESEDEGSSWFPAGLEYQQVSWVMDKPNGWLFAGTNDAGIARTNEELSEWEYINQGIACSLVKDLAMDNGGNLYTLTVGRHLHKWDPVSLAWSGLSPPQKSYGSLWAAPDNTLILSDSLHLTASDDGGISWWTTPDSFEVTGMAFSNSGVWYASGRPSVDPMEPVLFYRSADKGLNWEAITPESGTDLYEIRFYVIGNDTLFFSGIGFPFPPVFRSGDGGTTWETVMDLDSIVKPVIAEGLNGIFAIGPDIATNKTKIFQSTDGGFTWTLVKEMYLGMEFYQLAINSNGHLFLNVDGKVMKSSTGGKTWKLFSIADYSGYSRMLLAPDNILYKTYPFRGVWRTAVPTTAMTETPIPAFFDVRVSPNPASGLVEIKGLENEEGAIFLIDCMGRVLLQQPFSGDVQMDLSGFPAGIYLLRILTEQGSAGLKLIRG